jgi:hypothetical protein
MVKRIIKRGNILYEMDRFGNPIRLKTEADMRIRLEHIKNKEKSDNKRYAENPELEELEYYRELEEEPEQSLSPMERRKHLLKLVGNNKKLVSFADGLDREIPIQDRKKKKTKRISKRKPHKKCGCKRK